MHCIIIPAYQPDHTLLELVKTLNTFSALILIVNDGSDPKKLTIFKTLESYSSVKILHHETNQGKGQALKTGFQFFLQNYTNQYKGVITADADGQHSTQDIQHIGELFQTDPNTLLLGMRTFSSSIPWRSRIGNKLSSMTFNLLTGQLLKDTQTGLRAIPGDFLKNLMTLSSKGYEFELEMLLSALKHNIPIKEIAIQTIYQNGNRNSHFHPIKDAIKIYLVFLRFLLKKVHWKLIF